MEWAKGSPLRQDGLDALAPMDRFRMAQLLANEELSFFERRVAFAFRSPKDLSQWLLAGVEEWGVDAKFGPMRALRRAEQMAGFLSREPSRSGAFDAWRQVDGQWRSDGMAGKLAPGNAHTLMFKRRALPELAAVALAMKGVVSVPALIGGAALWPMGGGFTLLGGVSLIIAGVAKLIETGSSDHDKSGEALRELWAMRKSVCSEARLKRLAKAALAQARALGYKGDDQAFDGGELANGRPAKELMDEAKELERQRAKLLKGGMLSALDRGDEAARLAAQAKALKETAQKMEESKRSQKEPDLSESGWHLRNFATRVRSEAIRSLDPQELRAKSLTRVESAEIKKAIKEAAPASAPSAPARSSRL